MKLKRPITVDGREVRELTLRIPTEADFARYYRISSTVGKAMYVIEALTDLSRDQVLDIDVTDYKSLADQIADFLEGVRQMSRQTRGLQNG